MMVYAGCDVGSLTAKAVIVEDNRIIGRAVLRGGSDPAASARAVMTEALQQCGLSLTDLEAIIATGYGRERIDFAGRVESEIVCHARGACWDNPQVRTVIDIGGQDAKAIRLDADGKVIRYVYNDKCASGTGRFLEIMAEALEIELADMGDVGMQSTEKLTISNQCVIFAETEVISLVNDGKPVPDILKALHTALANRIASLAKSIGVEETVVITGGVAKNRGVFEALSESLGLTVQPLQRVDPQLNGALGAALLAADRPNRDADGPR
jgi:(R)-2-hydroxyacyl-CoA dehydratese activating ATPase